MKELKDIASYALQALENAGADQALRRSVLLPMARPVNLP